MKLKETFVCSLLLVASCANNPHLLPQASLNFLSQNPPSSLSDSKNLLYAMSTWCSRFSSNIKAKQDAHTASVSVVVLSILVLVQVPVLTLLPVNTPPHDLCYLLILGKVDQMRCRGLENKLTDVLAPIPFKELHRATSSFGLQMFLLQTTHTISSFTTKLIFVSQLSATFNCAKLRFKLKRFKNMNFTKLACCMIIIRQE